MVSSLSPVGGSAFMMGSKERSFAPLENVSLEELLPKDNFYRRVEEKLDPSFLRELVKDRYAASSGRTSIDPVVFFKLQLVLFFEDLRSERQLVKVAADRLSIRWYLGYDLNEPLADHSSLTRIRQRYGLEVFGRFFEEIVQLCVQAGLVWGEELYFDSTKVEANAAVDPLAPRWAVEAHLGELFDGECQEGEDPAAAETGPAVALPCRRPRRPPSRSETPLRAIGSPGPGGRIAPSKAATGHAPPTLERRRRTPTQLL
jgi:transposase